MPRCSTFSSSTTSSRTNFSSNLFPDSFQVVNLASAIKFATSLGLTFPTATLYKTSHTALLSTYFPTNTSQICLFLSLILPLYTLNVNLYCITISPLLASSCSLFISLLILIKSLFTIHISSSHHLLLSVT